MPFPTLFLSLQSIFGIMASTCFLSLSEMYPCSPPVYSCNSFHAPFRMAIPTLTLHHPFLSSYSPSQRPGSPPLPLLVPLLFYTPYPEGCEGDIRIPFKSSLCPHLHSIADQPFWLTLYTSASLLQLCEDVFYCPPTHP